MQSSGRREDRVAARADIGHVGFDAGAAVGGERHARFRIHHQVDAHRGGDAQADQPFAVAHGAGCRRAAGPAKILRAPIEALNQGAGRERRAGHRIDLGLVQFAEVDRIAAAFLGQFVDRGFQREHTDRFAGRADRAGHHHVERDDLVADMADGRVVERDRAERDGLHEAAIGPLADDAVVADRRHPAVLVGGEAQALVRIGAAIDVVEQLLARHRDLDRAGELLRGDRRHHRVGAEHLAAEAAADIG
jgi:hypothetical protein